MSYFQNLPCGNKPDGIIRVNGAVLYKSVGGSGHTKKRGGIFVIHLYVTGNAAHHMTEVLYSFLTRDELQRVDQRHTRINHENQLHGQADLLVSLDWPDLLWGHPDFVIVNSFSTPGKCPMNSFGAKDLARFFTSVGLGPSRLSTCHDRSVSNGNMLPLDSGFTLI